MNELVAEYCKSRGHRERINSVRNFYLSIPNIDIAIEKACFGQVPLDFGQTYYDRDNTKMDDHQIHIGYDQCNVAYQFLLENTDMLGMTNRNSFEELICITTYVAEETNGIGALWAYDAALRIGFHLNILPSFVYVPQGARWGAKNLLEIDYLKGKYLTMDRFEGIIPQPKPPFKAYEIENFLCVFHSDF